MRFSGVAVVLLFLMVLATAQSYICSRTAASDTYCNDDGTRTTIFYSYQPNVLTEAGWQPFEDVAVLEFKEDHFELSYGNLTARIDLFAVVDGKETATKDTELKIEPVIIKQHGGFEYGVRLDNADKIEAFGFRIGGDEIKEVKYDFSDANTAKTAVTMQDSKTAIVSNPTRAKELVIDPTVTFTGGTGNWIIDTYVNAASTGNHGTELNLSVGWYESGATQYANRTFIMFNTSYLPKGITITEAKLGVYALSVTNAASVTASNTTNDQWNETGVTWAAQPSADTSQGTATPSAGAWSSYTVTNAVLASFNSGNNTGFRLAVAESGVNKTYIYASKEYAVGVTKRPYVNITYTSVASAPEDNLVGYWKFNEGTGSGTDDSSGNGNIGIISGATWTTSKYRMNNTLTYDGVNDEVNVGNSSTLNFGTGDFTLCAWVKPLDYQYTSTPEMIIGKYNGTGSTEWILGYRNNHTYFVVRNSSSSTVTLYGNLIVPNSWIYLCGRRLNDVSTLWENGEVVNTSTETALGSLDSPASVCIGSYCGGGYLNSMIDEVKIFDTWKSAAYILAEYLKHGCLYDMNITAFNESSTSQQIYYDLILSNTTTSETFSDMWNWTSNNYCNGSTPMNDVTVSISNSSFYSPRYYYTDTSTSPNVTAYLLPITYTYEKAVTFYVSSGGNAVSDAEMTVQRQIGGGWVRIAEGITDSAGGFGAYLDSTVQYLIITNKTGYIVKYSYITPTANPPNYYISLAMGYEEGFPSMWTDINYTLSPSLASFTRSNTNYPFIFSISSLNSTLDYYGMNITNASGTQIFADEDSTASGGTITASINTSLHSQYLNVTVYFLASNYSDTLYSYLRQYYLYGSINESYVSLEDIVGPSGTIATSGLSKLTRGLFSLMISLALVGAISKFGGSAVESFIFVGSMSVLAYVAAINPLLWLGMIWFAVVLFIYYRM